MSDDERTVPYKEARAQVKVMAARLALMHLAFGRTLARELGPEKADELVVKAMMEYGDLAGRWAQAGHQDLPHYGLHDGYKYGDQEFTDQREVDLAEGEDFDWDRYEVLGCTLGQVFQ